MDNDPPLDFIDRKCDIGFALELIFQESPALAVFLAERCSINQRDKTITFLVTLDEEANQMSS